MFLNMNVKLDGKHFNDKMLDKRMNLSSFIFTKSDICFFYSVWAFCVRTTCSACYFCILIDTASMRANICDHQNMR